MIIWLRSSLSFLFLVLFSVPVWSMAGIISSIFTKNKTVFDNIIRSWSKVTLVTFGGSLKVMGRENLPKEEGVIFVFNHSSHFDIPAFYSAVDKSARFGAKVSLFSVPFMGWSMKRMGFLPIERRSREKVFELYDKSIDRVKNGESFVLAGEGGRLTYDGVGDRLKSGPFIFAIKGNLKIVPVVIKGARSILPKGEYFPARNNWSYPVSVSILPPVSTDGYTLETRDDLQKIVQSKMTEAHQGL